MSSNMVELISNSSLVETMNDLMDNDITTCGQLFRTVCAASLISSRAGFTERDLWEKRGKERRLFFQVGQNPVI
jgi:hypothetical protein